MIKTKSRSCKGVNSKKQPQNIGAGYDYNPAYKICNCFGAQGCKVKFVSPKIKHCNLKRLGKT